MITWVVPRPTASASRGVKNADSAVPTMPMPNTPVAKPRRFGGYQPSTNGTPMANVVPPRPRKNPPTSSAG